MKSTEKKIRKLKKSRLGPTIILFIISLIGGSLLLAVEFGLYSSYVVETKFAGAMADARNILSFIDGRMDSGTKLDSVLDSLPDSPYADSSITFFDSDGAVVCSYGELTADLSYLSSWDQGDRQEFVWDRSAVAAVEKLRDKGLMPRMAENFDSNALVLTTFISRVVEGPVKLDLNGEDPNDVVMEALYWQKIPVENDGFALIRSNLTIRQDDMLFGTAITAVSGIFFFLLFSIQFSNVIREIKNRIRIERLLMLDEVTGGDNRTAFIHKASAILERRTNACRTFAVVALSIPKYQSYCSLHGTKTGEKLLMHVSGVLSGCIDSREVLGHIGMGDFALLLYCASGDDGRRAAVRRVNEMLERLKIRQTPKGGRGAEPDDELYCSKLSFQAGIFFLTPSELPENARLHMDIDEFYVNAGIAKASIELEDGCAAACFDQKMLDDRLWQHKVENSMQAALDNEEFQVYIQPKYDPNTNELQGGEALVRWISPTEGMISPARFIPIFERTGFIKKLDDYMISHTAGLQSEWLAQGKKIVPVSVNVSRAHFAQPDLAECIGELVDVYKLPHRYIEIELTESAFFDDKKLLLSTVRKLQDLGFDVSMDDFGSGYSSLNSLKDLPINVLKLDSGFFRGEDFGVRSEIVVSKAISLAKQLDIRIVAEGVEKKEQVDFLAAQGCDMIQGYYYAKPMPADEYADRLK